MADFEQRHKFSEHGFRFLGVQDKFKGASADMNKSVRSEFDSVDFTTDPSDFVRYLDTTRATDFFQEIKRRTFTLLEVRAGQNVVDIGCGTGEDVRALAAQVGPSGRAVGVDISSKMIATATERSGNRDSNEEFVQGDVQKLPFNDACFDAIRAERLLQHTPDVDSALREMSRVVTPGGRIVSWEADLDLFIIDAEDYHTSRIMQRLISDSFRNGSIGHRLYRRFLELGFVDVQSTPLVHSFADFPLIETAFDLTASVERAVKQNLLRADRAMLWLDSLRSDSQSGRFISAIGGFITFGRKA
jgi:ubiquinone/menaquinone biosynthesis C-methylase UbiE